MHTRIREFALNAARAYRKRYRCDSKDASGCPDTADAPIQLAWNKAEDDAFRSVIGKDWEDDAPRLVYADYLDENGMSGLAEAYRRSAGPERVAHRMYGNDPDVIGDTLLLHSGFAQPGDTVGLSKPMLRVSIHGTTVGPMEPKAASVQVSGRTYRTTDMEHVKRLVSETEPVFHDGRPFHAHNHVRSLLGLPDWTRPTRPQQLARPRTKKLDPKITEALGGNARSGFIPTPESSWIRSLRYKPDTGVIMRVAKTGKDYPYPGLGLREFRMWLQSASKGKWWWRNVHDVMAHSTFGEPAKMSRWTGPVHRLMTPASDGPIDWHPLNRVSKADVMQWMRKHVHPQMTEAHLAALAGWVPGTQTTVLHNHSLTGDRQPKELILTTESPFSTARTITGRDYSVQRTIHGKFSPGGPHVENEHMIIGRNPGNQFKGLSGPVLLRQIRAAHEVGIPRIGWFSAYSEPREQSTGLGFTGGLHWPLMGADGYVHPQHAALMPQEIHDELARLTDGRWGQVNAFTGKPSYRFSDLAMSRAARDWYVENPHAHDSFVDTKPGSYSRRNIERHVAENAKQFGFPAPIPDHQLRQEPLAEHPQVQPGIGPAGFRVRLQMLLNRTRRKVYHPAHEHLIATGSLHPAYFDDYFCH